jgi:hypothetical protein
MAIPSVWRVAEYLCRKPGGHGFRLGGGGVEVKRQRFEAVNLFSECNLKSKRRAYHFQTPQDLEVYILLGCLRRAGFNFRLHEIQ